MDDIWRAAREGDLGEVERLVGQDPGLLDARNVYDKTPLMYASDGGHVGMVRWLLDHGAAVNNASHGNRITALWTASCRGHTPVVWLLLGRGADPAIADESWNPLMYASRFGHLEVARLLLGHASAKSSINCRDVHGKTALWWACCMGRGGVVRALLENGADPAIAANDGTTPTAIAKATAPLPQGVIAESRRECVAALEVRFCLPLSLASRLLVTSSLR
jgi:ankyrin repeat protein